MKFNRDKRGYENTFVVHTHGTGGRRRGRSRSRILYWFRTPPGVRIGRSALDEDAIRLIEQHNPDVEFDWTRILKGQDSQGPTADPAQDRRARPRPRDAGQRPAQARPAEASPLASVSAAAPEEVAEIASAPTATPAESRDHEQATTTEGRAEEPEVEVVESFLAEPRIEPPVERPQPGDAISAVEARLGAEGLARLRARYAEVMARISETISDPVRKDELKGQAERLNPDTWVTQAEVTAALEAYESVFESLKTVVGRRRKRRRRGAGRHEPAAVESAHEQPSSEPAEELESREPGEEQ